MRLGGFDEARRHLEELAADGFAALPFDQEWLFAMSFLAETSSALADIESAEVLYKLLQPWATFNAVDVAEGFRGSISRYLGLLAAAIGRPTDAASHFEEAVEMNDRMGARPWLAFTQEDYARMLLARNAEGDPDKAQQLIDEALGTYRELGMQPHATRAAALLQAAPL